MGDKKTTIFHFQMHDEGKPVVYSIQVWPEQLTIQFLVFNLRIQWLEIPWLSYSKSWERTWFLFLPFFDRVRLSTHCTAPIYTRNGILSSDHVHLDANWTLLAHTFIGTLKIVFSLDSPESSQINHHNGG